MENTILNEETKAAISELDELIKRAKNGEKIKSSNISDIARKVNDDIEGSKTLVNHAVVILCNVTMLSSLIADDKFSLIIGIINLILSIINQRLFSNKEHEKELKTFYESGIKKLEETIPKVEENEAKYLKRVKRILEMKLVRLKAIGVLYKRKNGELKAESIEVTEEMSGFLDELEMLDEAKEVPETIPGSGVRKVTTSQYMGKLPEHQAEDIDIQPRDEQIRKAQEPGLDRPVVTKKVQVQCIPGDGIKPTTTSQYMGKLPEKSEVDATEPTKDTACTLRPFAEEMELMSESFEKIKGLIEKYKKSRDERAQKRQLDKVEGARTNKFYDETITNHDGYHKGIIEASVVVGAINDFKPGNDNGHIMRVSMALNFALIARDDSDYKRAAGCCKRVVREAVSANTKGLDREINSHSELRKRHPELIKELLEMNMSKIQENTVSQATPIPALNKTDAPVKDPKISKVVNEDEEELIEEDAKKVARRAAVSGAVGSVSGIAKKVINNKLEGKKTTKKDIALGALTGATAGTLTGAALTAGGDAISKKGKKSESFEVEIDEDYVSVSESTMEYLMEAFDYELTEEEIMTLVAEAAVVPETIPGNGIKDTTTGRYMTKLPQYQSAEEAKPRKEDEAYTGHGSIVKPHDSSEDDVIANDLADSKCEDEALEESKELAVPTPKKEQKQELPGDGIKKMDVECENKFDNDACDPQKDQQFEENTDIEVSIFDPIKLNENEVRIIEQYGKYLISESDYESLCYNYAGKLNGYEVLDLVAEAHNIDPDDLYVMIAEGETVTKKGCKKAMSCKGSSNPKCCDKRKEAKIARLQAQLKDTASGSATAKELRRKIKELRKS